jgi:hypothetical protein
MLLAEQPAGGALNPLGDLLQTEIHAAIARLCGRCGDRLRIPWKCAHLAQTFRLKLSESMRLDTSWPGG